MAYRLAAEGEVDLHEIAFYSFQERGNFEGLFRDE
jgi:hypothetical protein